jgi:hypothetical protein
MRHDGAYILESKTVKSVSMIEWAKWMEDVKDRHVAYTPVAVGEKKCTVSTVFLGLDHNFTGHAGDRPVLFETMVFYDCTPYENKFGRKIDHEWEEFMRRYSTWEEAEAGHEKLVAWLKAGNSIEEFDQ